MKKYRNKIKITSLIFLLLVGLLSPVQGAQPILQDSTTKDYNYKPLVDLFKIRELGLEVIKYIGCKNEDSMIALHWSVGLGYLECAKYVVEQGPSIKFQSKYSSALPFYAFDGYLRVVEFLLQQGAGINATDNKENTALHLSAERGHLDIVKYLVEQGADINTQNENRNTALQTSVFNGHVECVKYLVEQGADVHGKNGHGDTALFLSAYEGHLDCLKSLVRQGADVHDKNEYGSTALHWSAYNGHLESVKYLMEKGANIYAKNKWGNTALQMSAINGHEECVKFLHQQGGDINAKDNDGKTALSFAKSGKKQNIIKYLVEEQWLWAAKNGNKELLERLYAEYKDLIEKHKDTALMWSAENEHEECVKLLLQQGAKNKKPPLFLSAYKGYLNWLDSPVKQICNLCIIL